MTMTFKDYLLESGEEQRKRMELYRQKAKDERIEKETGKKPRHSALGINDKNKKQTGTFVYDDDD